MNYNISFSMLREYRRYKQGDVCGLFWYEKFIAKSIEDRPRPGSPAHAGLWFEQECTGVQHRDGVTLMPDVRKDGKPTAIYEHLTGQLANFKALGYADDVKGAGVEIYTDLDGHIFKGVVDVVTSDALRDIKTTGKINDVWDGWGFSEKHPFTAKPVADQARMYIWLWWRNYGEIRPFYFDVFANTNTRDYKVIPCEMTADTVADFEARMKAEADLLTFDVATGLEACPSPERCHACPLAGNCEFKTNETERILL